MSLQQKIKHVIRRAERQGFRHEILGNNHHRFYAPDGHTIVQCSSTTRDGGWWGKFMREMHVAGYKEYEVMNGATTNLGAALKAAHTAVPATPAPIRQLAADKPARGAIRRVLRDYLRDHPDMTFTAGSVGIALRARGFVDMTDTKAGQHLIAMFHEGLLRKLDTGSYKLRHAADLVSNEPPPPDKPTVGAVDLQGIADTDEHELDEALAALGRIEAVVRKYKGAIRQLAEVRRVLDTLGLGK